MKTILMAILALLGVFRASAQVSVEVVLDQDQFLPGEPLLLAVNISNESGQELHLGADPGWLTFNVEAEDNFVVAKNSDVPVVDPFDLESSQRGIKHVDLEPYFQLGRPGRYKVTATVRIKEWGLAISSAPAHFDIINGVELWTQNFGVMVATNAPPEPRRYALIEANYLREQLRLYAQVADGDGQILKVTALGPLVSFSAPEEQVDRFSRLHVLWQTGAQAFYYTIVSADGVIVSHDIYDDFNSRPRLALNPSGEVMVSGGVLRRTPAAAPLAKLPESPAASPASP